MAGSSR